MKYFTHPEGIFEMKIPLDWYYKNKLAGYEDKSPFSFEPFENTQGAFQISCYPKDEKKISPDLPKGKYNENKLKFAQSELPDDEFKVFLWGTVVQDYFFMAKYVCQPTKKNIKTIKEEIRKVEESLSTLMCLSIDRRNFAIGFDRFEKFNGSLAASFDLKENALNNHSFTELIIINSNQIDAYLRLCIVLKFQVIEKTNLFKLEYLYQSESDKPIFEKKVYDKAKEMHIISNEQHDRLYKLYALRNNVVHRYIITDIKTIELKEIAYEYEILCEDVRLILADIETEQFKNKVGYHGTHDPHRDRDQNDVNELFSIVNDKHSLKNYYRDI